MRVLLIAIGTRGDVQPFIVIGKRLMAQGHDVHLAAADGFASEIAASGVTHHPLPLDFKDLLEEPEMQEALSSVSGKLKAYSWAADAMNGQLSAIWKAGLEVEPEIILYHFKGALAPYLGRKLNVPAWPVMLQPGFAPTRAYPQFLVAARSLGGLGNLASHRLIMTVMRAGTNMMLRRWRKASGVDLGQKLDVLAGFDPSGAARRLHAYSPHIVPLGHDMDAREIQTGYAFESPGDYTPSQELASFLTAGDMPIYAGFGSMPGINQERVSEALLAALDRTGHRAVVASGWGGFGKMSNGSNVHVLEAVPHSWLFPKVAAVVHHGGSGTTHEGLRWGRPSVICPLFGDQPFFGHRIAKLGAGPEPVAQKKLTADRLARALDAAASGSIRERAAAIGRQMHDEDGAGTIADLLG